MLVDLIQSDVWPRYRAIVQGIESALETRRLRVGDRLPTQRELAEELGVAVATVGRAYAELEAIGLVRSHVGRGTFVSTREASGVPMAEVGVDLATYKVPVPPIREALARAMNGLLASGDPAMVLGGAPAAGLPHHRQAIAVWLRRQGITADAEQVVVTNGGQHSTMAALSTLTHEGEALATEELTDPRMKAVAAYLGRRLVAVGIDEHGMLPDALDACCRTQRPTAIYVTTRCQNPTTATLPLDRRIAIAEIARKHDLPIIESDIYGSLCEDPDPSIAVLAPERTHFIGAFGRIAGPGMKVGWIVSPLRDVVRTQAGVGMSTGAATLLSAELAGNWIADGTMDVLAQWQRADNARRLAVVSACGQLARAKTQPRCAHVWLTLPDRWRAEELVESAAIHKIGIAPTHSFVVGRQLIPHAVRLCIGAAADTMALGHACDRLDRLLGTTPRFGMEAA